MSDDQPHSADVLGDWRDEFDTLHGEFLAQADETLAAIEAGTYSSAMGHSHGLVVGRKPAA